MGAKKGDALMETIIKTEKINGKLVEAVLVKQGDYYYSYVEFAGDYTGLSHHGESKEECLEFIEITLRQIKGE